MDHAEIRSNRFREVAAMRYGIGSYVAWFITVSSLPSS